MNLKQSEWVSVDLMMMDFLNFWSFEQTVLFFLSNGIVLVVYSHFGMTCSYILQVMVGVMDCMDMYLHLIMLLRTLWVQFKIYFFAILHFHFLLLSALKKHGLLESDMLVKCMQLWIWLLLICVSKTAIDFTSSNAFCIKCFKKGDFMFSYMVSILS